MDLIRVTSSRRLERRHLQARSRIKQEFENVKSLLDSADQFRSKELWRTFVDDERTLLTALCNTLSEQGHETTGFTTAAEAFFECLQIQEFDILITDMNMAEMDGMNLLAKAKEFDTHLVPIMMTGQAGRLPRYVSQYCSLPVRTRPFPVPVRLADSNSALSVACLV